MVRPYLKNKKKKEKEKVANQEKDKYFGNLAYQMKTNPEWENFIMGEGDCWNSENNPTIRVFNSSKAMKNRIFS